MKKYILILLVLVWAPLSWAKKETRGISSEEGIPITYYFVMPAESTVAKDFKITVTKTGTSFLGQLKVKLQDGENKELQLPCYLLKKVKVLRCVREDGGGRFEISSFINPKGEKAYRLKVSHLDLGSEQDEPTAISNPTKAQFLEVDGKIIP